VKNAQAQAINRYVTEINKIYRTGQATEHGYRPSLKTLFEGCFTGPKTPLKDSFTGSKTLLKDGFTDSENCNNLIKAKKIINFPLDILVDFQYHYLYGTFWH
jgi:hypothetical protein